MELLRKFSNLYTKYLPLVVIAIGWHNIPCSLLANRYSTKG